MLVKPFAYSKIDPLIYGHTCGLGGVSYLPHVTWRTSQDYIEFARGWRAGNAERKRREAQVLPALERAAAEAWRRELAERRNRDA